jgi:hypothetical protein
VKKGKNVYKIGKKIQPKKGPVWGGGRINNDTLREEGNEISSPKGTVRTKYRR